ncbi:serine protease FAM111A isoform X2 [Salmo salar]|uniref:Serine protease FAM111A isoform X2 n=1 Tax=Salmo salar TaxID=8030 RepID=A0ABM3EAC0_SALSA|nr:serine protease FAM111A-like isoform X2 [Salmo salar]
MAAMVKSEPLDGNGDSLSDQMATKMKITEPNDSMKGHLHYFSFKFPDKEDQNKITCNSPCSVLQALETSSKFCELKEMTEKQKMKTRQQEKTMQRQDLVIQTTKGKKPIATHFPCHLLENGQILTISTISNDSGEATTEPTQIYTGNKQYVIFYIESKGGKKTKTKQLLKNKKLEPFSPLCIYGICGETVETALTRDGRFHDNVFTKTCILVESDSDPASCVEMNVLVDCLDKQTFKMILEEKNPTQAATAPPQAGSNLQKEDETNSIQLPMFNTSTETSAAGEPPKKQLVTVPDSAEILKILRHQFADLVKQMKKRYKKKKYSGVLSHLSGEFGKSTQGFSEVYTVKKLMRLSDSVCMIDVEGVGQGTGFLLFDHYILTNAHLFINDGISYVDGNYQNILAKVTATFNKENPNGSDLKVIEVKSEIIDFQWGSDHYNRHVDFAVLELQDVDTSNGLLRRYSPDPKTGGVCLIGHPGGGVKRTDPTTIIERERRGEAFQREIGNNVRMDMLINTSIEENKVKYDMLMNPDNTEVTYDTCLFHGASGSPVFDESCQVIAMHTGGFPYEDEGVKSVIEYAIPLLTILEDFLIKMKDRNNVEILTKFTREALTCPHLHDLIYNFIRHLVNEWKPSFSAALTAVWDAVEENENHLRIKEHLRTWIISEKEVLEKIEIAGNEALKEFMLKNDLVKLPQ